MQAFDFSPFYRSTVGFDRVFNKLDTLTTQEAKTYPPYNIERKDDDSWIVTVAVAGFALSDIAIETKENGLTIKGGKSASANDVKREFLHRGIAERSFDLRFQLGDYVEVKEAQLENGLLHLVLKREVPEHKKARQISITSAQSSDETSIEDKSVN